MRPSFCVSITQGVGQVCPAWGRLVLSVSNRATLQAVLTTDYNGLFKQLTRRLGSAELAGDALQETFLRLDRVSDATIVRRPREFLVRVASNIAADRQRVERRYLSAAEVVSLLDVRDEAPDPAKVVEARSELEALGRALAELSPRRRRVFRAAMLENMPDHEIAALLNINVRTVESDLKYALKYCASRLGRNLTRRCGGPRPRN
jgi:RNA polymerase sigma-70 factor (ECF subfamily)